MELSPQPRFDKAFEEFEKNMNSGGMNWKMTEEDKEQEYWNSESAKAIADNEAMIEAERQMEEQMEREATPIVEESKNMEDKEQELIEKIASYIKRTRLSFTELHQAKDILLFAKEAGYVQLAEDQSYADPAFPYDTIKLPAPAWMWKAGCRKVRLEDKDESWQQGSGC